jgi:hypothetical protein
MNRSFYIPTALMLVLRALVTLSFVFFVLSLRILFLIYLFSTFKTKFGLLSSEMSNLPNMVNYIQMKLEIQNDDTFLILLFELLNYTPNIKRVCWRNKEKRSQVAES